jgi:hypothetical protein
MNEKEKNEEVLSLIKDYGGIDGGHHKQWLLDKIVQVITGDEYDEWVNVYENEDGVYTYEWDRGCPP